ncbi:MAG: sulfatase [Candidatus Solibacter usitatus]|nr:sulfatase [Candidatus Solibacter usitatus]
MSQILSRREAITIAAAPFLQTSRTPGRRPNFLFLLTDDQSYATTSLTGSAFMKTPNMDRIGREGVLFTNGFVAMSLCAPSRACFLTGLYPHKNGIIGNQIRWNQQLQTLPGVLHQNGYRTAHMGKFHMDGDDRVQPGYDYWAAQVGQGQYVNPRKNVNGKWEDLVGYDTNIVTDQAISFLRANKSQPFCAWIGFKACHGPFTPAPGHEKDFSNLPFQPPSSFFLDDTGKPQRVRQKSQNSGSRAARAGKKKNKKKQAAGDPPGSVAAWSERERNYHRCLMGAEDNIGRIFAFLEEEKLLEDTIVFFSGDNGFFHGEHSLHGKMEAYEEALRVPMMVRYPRAIAAGQRCDAFVSNVDLAPSILDLCGIKPPRPMQGQSWKGLVTGQKNAPRRDSFVYTMHGAEAAHPTVKALRTDRYKLILNLNPGDKPELYDLKTDPQEMKNLADSGNRAVLSDLRGKLLAEMKKIEDPAIADVEAVRF